jgi:hypothetical protein
VQYSFFYPTSIFLRREEMNFPPAKLPKDLKKAREQANFPPECHSNHTQFPALFTGLLR